MNETVRLSAANIPVASEPLEGKAPRWRWPLARILATGLGLLMLLAVGGVFLIGLIGAQRNTAALLGDKADLGVAAVVERVRAHLDPVQVQTEYLKALLEDGLVDGRDPKALTDAFMAAMAATPQVAGLAFVASDMTVIRIDRAERAMMFEDWSDRPGIPESIEASRRLGQARWLPPVWSDQLQQTILTMNVPIFGREGFRGVLIPVVTVTELSRYIGQIANDDGTAFILFGRDRVLAHPNLPEFASRLGPDNPLPSLGQIGDPILAMMWSSEAEHVPILNRMRSEGHLIERPDDYYVFIYREMNRYGATPWTVGTYMAGSQVGGEVERLQRIAAAGLVLLVLSVLVAILAGKWMSRPIRAFASAARKVQRLELRSVPRLAQSNIQEFDEAGRAFNSMVATLRWVETYLPRKLVSRLMAQGDDAKVHSEAREVTVLFTDINGFSRLAANLSAAEAADFLNRHFGLIGACIEAEGGTIDKYIGDSVMAFWGAPDDQPDHALRACRAAKAVAEAIRTENVGRKVQGQPPIGTRIGVHTGTVIVGNIGSPGRINYTLVGDAVNIAERVEQLAKEHGAFDDVCTLITGVTAKALGGALPSEPRGSHRLRGRDDEVEVHRLL